MIIDPTPNRNVKIISGPADGRKGGVIVKVKHPTDNIVVRYETGAKKRGKKLYGEASMRAAWLEYC